MINNNEFLEESYVDKLKSEGYIEIYNISLPNDTYPIRGGGYQKVILERTSSLLDTGYVIVTESGIRGSYDPIKENVTILDGRPLTDVYKIMSKAVIDIRDDKLNELGI